MTEAEWLACSVPEKMLKFLQGKASDRKFRLFTCACCRRIWSLVQGPASRRAVEVAERYADGLANRKELDRARAKVNVAARSSESLKGATVVAWETTRPAVVAAARSASHTSSWWATCEPMTVGNSIAWKVGHVAGELAAQADVLREIVGNPFRPLTPRGFPPTVGGLARAVNEGEHSLYPLLADALEDLGEADAASHCRAGGHVKGCHVVDWVLGMA